MRTRNFLRSCWHGLVGRAPAYLFGAVFTAGLAFSLTSYAVHDINVFELDNGTTGANAIDESDIDDADRFSPDDWAQNNFPDTGICPDGLHSCGYVAGPNVDPTNPGGSAFLSLFIQDPNGAGNNDDIFTGGGSKDDLDVSQWQWTTGSAPDKDDLLPIGAAAYREDIDADSEDELLIYLFGTLFAPNGSAAVGAWLFKKNIGACADGSFGVVDSDGNCLANQPDELHTVGDVFVVAETASGGREVQMQVFKWVGSDAAAKAACVADGFTLESPLNSLCKVLDEANALCTDGLHNDDACGSMNLGAVKSGKTSLPGFPTESPDDWGFQSKFPPSGGLAAANPPGTDGIGNDDFPETSLFEAGFNFSNLFPNEVGCFNSFLMNTRSSHSVRATLKDLALGSFPLCGISVDKTGDTLGKIGDPVGYTVTVTNTGAITQSRVSIEDTLLGDLADPANPYVTSSTCGATLAAGASCVIEATRTVVAGDPDPLPNTVTVVYSSGGDESTAEASHSVNLFQPSVTIDKTGDTLSKVGDTVNYTITVNNTSSADSPDLVCDVTDTLLGTLAEDVTLASGAPAYVIQTSRVVQEGDPDPLPNTATVTCSPEGFPNVLTESDNHSVNLFQPSVNLVKTGDELSKATDDVTYTITLNNTSSADSPDLECTISDPMLGLNKQVTLASGASDVSNEVYTVLAGDPDPLLNTATASCSPIGFPNVLPASDGHSINLFQPSVTIDKSAVCAAVAVGADITYTYTISNTSSPDSPALNLASIVDDKLGSLATEATAAGCDVLAAGASCNFSKVASTAGGLPGTLTNTVNVLYNPAGFPNPITANDSQSCNIVLPNPATVVIEKLLLGGENLAFDFSATNLSVTNFSLTPLFVGQPLPNSPFVSPAADEGFATTIELTVEIADITQTEEASVTEDDPLPAFVDFVSLECRVLDDSADGSSPTGLVSGTTATLTLGSGDFAFCRYVNQFTPPGDDGCTPGFWKNHLGDWVLTGYAPTDELQSVFDFVGVNGQIGGLADDTMLQALNYGGGNSKLGAAQILLRAAVAAVLNAAHPDVQFSFSEAQVIALVNAQLQSGTRESMLTLATELDNANNGVTIDNGGTESCPLGGPLPQ